MSKLILGDNPFFGISHLSPNKSKEYLDDKARWQKASEVIKYSAKLGINCFMISSHKETNELLKKTGYGKIKSLPDLCLVVPNVHDINAFAASGGIINALNNVLRFKNPLDILNPKLFFRKIILSNLNYKKIKYVALHNVIVDLLLGLKAKRLLSLFCKFTNLFGYKPVLITLNPLKLMKLNLRCHAICCYYNIKNYNVCSDGELIIKEFKQNKFVSEIWAMGILASGEVKYKDLSTDKTLKHFSKIVIASIQKKRIKELSQILNYE